MEFKRLSILVGISIVVVLVAITAVLQYKGEINLLANLSEIWLFGILLPGLSFAVILIVKGSAKRDGHIGRLLLGHEVSNQVVTTEQNLEKSLRPLLQGEVFDTEILPHPQNFHVGDPVKFIARFKGKLTYGCIQAEYNTPDGVLQSVPCYETVDRHPSWFTKGKLNGFYDRVTNPFEWRWAIPQSFPIGEHTFRIRAYERTPYSKRVSMKMHIILWFHRHVFRSIDLKQLDPVIWTPVHQRLHTVIISA
jgi:hypothetical protein